MKTEKIENVNPDTHFAEWCMKYMYSKHKDGFYRSPINVLVKFTIQELYEEYEKYKNLDALTPTN